MEWRRLYEYRLFYSVYPQLKDEILSYFRGQRQNILNDRSLGSLTAMSYMLENDDSTILRPMVAISRESWMVSPSRLFHCISYSSLQILSEIKDSLKRSFYEYELIQYCWSKRQLDHQISSLYYERSALSKNKDALKNYIQKETEIMDLKYIFRDPMTLDFL